VQAQRAAVSVAAARGLDPDQPRGLTRSVVLASGGEGTRP
jgi:glucosamine 6-phosphate synthetase-like amidotransferase/phosphosugar isomerase protein